MVQGSCAFSLEEMDHACLGTQMLTMQGIWTRGILPQAMSSCLLEVLIVVSEACKEAIWLAQLVRDLGILVEVPTLHCDSQSAIMLAKN